MKTAYWETSTGALLSMLNSANSSLLFFVDCYTITLSGGGVLQYCENEVAVTFNNRTFAAGPTIERGSTSTTVGVQVDTLDITFGADSTTLVNGAPLLSFIAGGGMDGAHITLERVFAPAPNQNWVGSLLLFVGRVGPINMNRYSADIQVLSDLELLTSMVPRNVYQLACGNTLYDGACGLKSAAFQVSGQAITASDATQAYFGTNFGTAYADNYFQLGVIKMTSGSNAGVSRTIKVQSGAEIGVIHPWPEPISIADTFTIYPGCDKTMTTCNTKFNNLVRFRGFPFVPAPETAVVG